MNIDAWTQAIQPYAYGRTVWVYTKRSGPYADGLNIHMVRKLCINAVCYLNMKDNLATLLRY